jgi:hypothetical protein
MPKSPRRPLDESAQANEIDERFATLEGHIPNPTFAG